MYAQADYDETIANDPDTTQQADDSDSDTTGIDDEESGYGTQASDKPDGNLYNDASFIAHKRKKLILARAGLRVDCKAALERADKELFQVTNIRKKIVQIEQMIWTLNIEEGRVNPNDYLGIVNDKL